MIDFGFVNRNFSKYTDDEKFDNATWIEIGNNLFKEGQYEYCIGSWFDNNRLCRDIENLGVQFVWQNKDKFLWSSGYENQLENAFFEINSVLESTFVSHISGNKSFQKILEGNFSCRLLEYGNESEFIELKNGKFRIPIWVNQFELPFDHSWLEECN